MQFPGVLANDNVSFDIKKGEVFALVGENGAGKSTLMNILYGINTPTNGSVYIKGNKMEKHTPSEAIENGVGMVHQHFMLVPSFTVAQNIALSKEPRKHKVFYDLKAAEKATQDLVNDYGLVVNPKAVVQEISVGLQQRVEVREKDMTVIIITHKLYEVMAISDRVGVMRQGKLVGVENTKDVNEKVLASMMVGRDVLFDKMEKHGVQGDVQIEVRDLQVADNRGLLAVRGVDLKVHAGEILGIAAIEGNGQSELLEAITGMRGILSGEAFVEGVKINGMNPGQIRKLGLAHIPEDRIATGVSSSSTITENLIIGKERRQNFSKYKIHLMKSSITRYAQEISQKFDIRGAGVDTEVGSLSGGNMQKVVVAREFSFDTPVLIIAQPTRGVDVGAIEFIHQSIINKRNEGCAILLVSADLDEIFRLSDRIITMYEGKVTGEFAEGEIDKMDISYYMTGDRSEASVTQAGGGQE